MRRFLALTGFDRSGTTFFGRYIQRLLSKSFFMGELDRGIHGLLGRKYMKCSCGKTLPDCSLWSKVIPEIRIIEDHPRMTVKVVCDKVFQIIQPEVIIDSSKDLHHVKNTLMVFNTENTLLHIVRNPKGVAFSRMKTRLERVKSGRHPKPQIASRINLMLIYDSVAWCMTNIYIELFLKYRCKQYHRIIYEKSQTELALFLETYFNDLLSGAEHHISENHVIFGNMNRFQDSGTIAIDESWKTNLNTYQKLAVDFITFPVRLVFNYGFRT